MDRVDATVLLHFSMHAILRRGGDRLTIRSRLITVHAYVATYLRTSREDRACNIYRDMLRSVGSATVLAKISSVNKLSPV
jgi:hypothetical protein